MKRSCSRPIDPGFRRGSKKLSRIGILSQALRRSAPLRNAACDGPSGQVALLSMREVLMALRKFLILRKLRSSCLEGCGTLIQPTDNFLTGPCTGTINIATVSDKFRNDIF